MFYKFRIISDEIKDFARELLIASDSTFLDFHHCLQEDLGYDPKQLASFFITNASWEKKLQITLIDMMDDESENCITMDQEKLENHIKEVEQRMLYVYDFFSERSFFIELTEIQDLPGKMQTPKIIFSHGSPPTQIELGLDVESISEDIFDDDLSSDEFDDEFDFIDTDNLPDE